MEIVDHTGIEHPLFRRLADRGYPQQGILVLFVQEFISLPHALAPEVVRGKKLRLVVVDVQINRLLGPALQNHHIPAGKLELGAEITAGIGAGDRTGQRALGNHRVTAAGRGRGAGQRACGKDQLVVRRQRIHLGVDFLNQVLGCQPPLPQIIGRPLHVQGFGLAGARGQIHA